jgi:microsomal dipeptidase-like Zn-dependent dipeptidase
LVDRFAFSPTRRYGESDIEQIMCGNWLSLLERAWTAEA